MKPKTKNIIKNTFKFLILIVYMAITLEATYYFTTLTFLSFLNMLIKYNLLESINLLGLKYRAIISGVGAYLMCWVSQLYVIDKLFGKKKEIIK